MTWSESELKIFTGTAHPRLGAAICESLGVRPAALEVTRFADGECFAQIAENVRGTDVCVIQPMCPPVNENFMEMLVILDAVKRSSAARITAVLPYYGYARQEKKIRARVPISAKLVADLLTVAGADRVLTVDLHNPAIMGFFDIPVDQLNAVPVLAEDVAARAMDELVVVSPDAGGVERARQFAKRVDAGLVIIDKRREKPNVARVYHVIGDVRGKNAVIVDDIIDTAGTLAEATQALLEAGANSVRGYFSHAVLSGPALSRLREMDIEEIVVTDTIPLSDDKRSFAKLRTLSVAPLLGEAILRIHNNSSVSELFNN